MTVAPVAGSAAGNDGTAANGSVNTIWWPSPPNIVVHPGGTVIVPMRNSTTTPSDDASGTRSAHAAGDSSAVAWNTDTSGR